MNSFIQATEDIIALLEYKRYRLTGDRHRFILAYSPTPKPTCIFGNWQVPYFMPCTQTRPLKCYLRMLLVKAIHLMCSCSRKVESQVSLNQVF